MPGRNRARREGVFKGLFERLPDGMEKGRLHKYPVRIIAVLVFAASLIMMGTIEPGFRAYSGGADLLDMRFGYDSSEVYQLFGRLGAEGRSLYAKNLFIDFAFIVSFAFLQNDLLNWILGRAAKNGRWRILLSFACLRGMFDIVENILILVLLYHYPAEYGELAMIAGYGTMLKFIFLGAWLAAIPAALAARWRTGAPGSGKREGKAR